ncbi:hypothetical protein BDZ45DRAFT_726572 [Acephala macrosclerotiorum]|nr:hypothetical protein BDZ45DRAFT_726572 [Acephala macrosclerotiorum]
MPTIRRESGKSPLKSYADADSHSGDQGMIIVDAPHLTEAEPHPESMQLLTVPQPQAVFQTFESDKSLDAGLCILRDLGGGKYEIVNLKNADHLSLTSQDMGLALKKDEARLEALSIDTGDWELAQFKCEQAVKSAAAAILRFQNLPLELRMKVYDFMVFTKPLCKVKVGSSYTKTGPFSLMQTCKQLYQETKPFFYQNNFKLNDIHKSMKANPSFRENLKKVSIEWTGYHKERDSSVFRFLATCKSLETLDIQILRTCVERNHTRQRLYQGMDAIKKFNKCPNFDNLVRISGLNRVTVDGAGFYGSNNHSFAELPSAAEVQTFQIFLNGILTLPRDPPSTPLATQQAIPNEKAAVAKKGKKRAREEGEEGEEARS